MFALEPVIVARLREVLVSPWQVVGDSTDEGARKTYPLAVVTFSATNVSDSKTGAAAVQTAWRVQLTARKSVSTADVLDAAFGLTVRQLHNWAPGVQAGRGWEKLRLIQVLAPEPGDEGLIAADLIFNTAARYDGQD